MKILLAVDGSSGSEAAVKEVARRPWPPGSELKMISVVDPTLRPTAESWVLSVEHYTEVDDAARSVARAALDQALEQFQPDASLTITTEVLAGRAQEVILDEAEKWRADLIVVGSRGLRSLERFLLGSVSKEVALQAKCSVEIVREREEAGE